MGVRSQAILWLERNYGKPDGPICTSKYYRSEESWPKTSVWWFQIPIRSVEENLPGHINLICQTGPNANTFHYLKVPAQFFMKHKSKFHITQDNISIYLSTDLKRLFIEERGSGSLNFSNFLIDNK